MSTTHPYPRPAARFRLEEGREYRFNFPGLLTNRGVFIGFVTVAPGLPQWIAFEETPGEVRFYNASLLCSIVPLSTQEQ